MNRAKCWIFTAIVVLCASPNFAAAQVAYLAATWGDNAIHKLDSNLNDLGSFPAGAGTPNGVTTDGTLIYSGHFGPARVYAYDLAGNQQFNWTNPALGNLQGMALVNGEMAVVYDPTNDSNVTFLNPATGAFIRTIPNVGGGTVEGMTYDGSLLWLLGDQLLGVDPSNGNLVKTLPNAAIGTDFGGTGIALGGPNQFVLAAPGGQWFRVSAVDGSVINSGNNGLVMYDLTSIGVPEPCSAVLACLAFVGLLARAATNRARR